MDAKVYITIPDFQSLMDILSEGRSKGLFKNLVISNTPEFPIQIPIDLDNVIDLVGNPIVKKMFGPKIDGALTSCLQKIFQGG